MLCDKESLRKEGWQQGYDAAFGEMYRSCNNDAHHGDCDSCRACGVVSEVAESMVQQLAAWMTEEEVDYFADLIIRVGERRRIAKEAGKGTKAIGWLFTL